jgi:hypothetical protein
MKAPTVFALYCISLGCAHADTFTLTPASSAEVGPSWVDNVNGDTSRVGLTGSGGFGRAAFYAFSMPKIAFGDKINGASLSFYMSALEGTGFTFDGDLYSLGVSSSTAATTADYFNGTYGSDSNAVALQQNFLTPSSTPGTISANSTGNADLAADLAGYEAAGYTAGSYYLLRLTPSFTGSPTNAYLGYNVSLTGDVAGHRPSLNITTATPPQLGRVLIEYWTGITGTYVSNLTGNTAYPNQPSAREYPTVAEIPQNLGTNSGDRMRCYFYPPVSGSYTFAIASADNSILLFSTDGNPADATQVADIISPTGYQSWSGNANDYQQHTFTLTAGQKCYIETLHKHGTSTSSNLSLGWNPPAGVAGSGSVGLMPATY